MTADEILEALIVRADDFIWATELPLLAGRRRIDFWTLMPSYSNGYRATAYEIKISRADFKRDDDGKQEAALRFCDRFWYVTPQGMLKLEEIPTWAGLQEWTGDKFKVIKKPPQRTKSEPTWELVCSILRSAGDCRRDVGLMKAELAFHKQQIEGIQRRRKASEKLKWDKWVRRSQVNRTIAADL